MGLDMYLNRKYYVQNWEHTPKEERHKITIKKGGKPATIPTDKITYIETQEIYWRKANAIHKWFVDNVQHGKDDCGTYYVSSEQLGELLGLCNKVLEASTLVKGKIKNGERIVNGKWTAIMEDGELIENPSDVHELLPTTSGFFFGGTDYDQYYFENVKRTKEELEWLLADDDSGDFYYHSSW